MLHASRDVDAFISRCREAADIIREEASRGLEILVVGHNDADGLSSIGVVAGSLLDLGVKFAVRSVFRLDEFIEVAAENRGRLVILTDMGGGNLSELKEALKDSKLVIVDHHQPEEAPIPEGWIHVNPHHFGIDGEVEVSASGVAYLVMRRLVPDPERYVHLAVVGGLGDLQDKGEKRSLLGVNAEIVKEAVKSGVLRVYEDFLLYGRASKPVHQALAGTQTPYLPGLSGDEASCLSLLIEAGLEVRDRDVWRTIADLTGEEKSKLYNAVVSHLAKHGQTPEAARDMIGTIYEIVPESSSTGLRDAREFAQVLNACGKTEYAWLGAALAMGYRGWVLDEAWKIVEKYRSLLRRGLELAVKNAELMYNIVVVRVGQTVDVRHVSSIASILSTSKILPTDKPLIVVGQEEGVVKVSARASPTLVARGLNLGSVMKDAASKFSGRGGGHRIAAGAEIPAERITLFLLEVDRVVGEMLSKHGAQITLDEDL